METLTGEQLVTKLVNLQASANALGWTVTAVQVPQTHAEAMVQFYGPPDELPLRPGMKVMQLDGVTVSVGETWK